MQDPTEETRISIFGYSAAETTLRNQASRVYKGLKGPKAVPTSVWHGQDSLDEENSIILPEADFKEKI